jgi:hypothetical protein
MYKSGIYRRPIPRPAPAPFVDLPLAWGNLGPLARVDDCEGHTSACHARPGLLHVVDGHRYRLEMYVYPNGTAMKQPCHCGILATAARFYLEVQP